MTTPVNVDEADQLHAEISHRIRTNGAATELACDALNTPFDPLETFAMEPPESLELLWWYARLGRLYHLGLAMTQYEK